MSECKVAQKLMGCRVGGRFILSPKDADWFLEQVDARKSDLSAAMEVVEAAKQLSAAIGLSMGVETYHAILRTALSKMEEGE